MLPSKIMILPISNKVEHLDIFKNKNLQVTNFISNSKGRCKVSRSLHVVDYKHYSIRLAGLLIFARPSVFTSTVAVELAISRSVDHS